jgi:NTE family protein
LLSQKTFREANLLENQKQKEASTPGTWQDINVSIQIMQDRITRVNLAVNPPNILITPRLGDLKLLGYDQVEHAIAEGYIATQHKVNDIRMLLDAQNTLEAF